MPQSFLSVKKIKMKILLDTEQARHIASTFSTPVYVYSESAIQNAAEAVLSFPNAFGLTARFAMKANPNRTILRMLSKFGLQIDASSEHEARRAMLAGIKPEHILLTAQECAQELKPLIELGVQFTATSFEQIEAFGKLFPGREISIRLNPGLGSGGTKRTNVGGPASSFGIWHEQVDQAQTLTEKYQLKVVRIHTHIGSGTDPEVWQRVAEMSMSHLERFKEADTLNLGGGFKVGRMPDEKSVDLQKIGFNVKEVFLNFAEKSGRKIRLEIEPGTFLMANAGCILAKIDSIVKTGDEGYTFYKLNTGMTELIRPSMYGAQHPITVVTQENTNEFIDVIVVGHCCESGDIFTPQPGDPEGLLPRRLPQAAPGDLAIIGGAGAYGAGFSAVNYNSFPEVAQVMLCEDGRAIEIRGRQTLEQIVQNEIELG